MLVVVVWLLRSESYSCQKSLHVAKERPGFGIAVEERVCLQVKLKRFCGDLNYIHARKKISPFPNHVPFGCM